MRYKIKKWCISINRNLIDKNRIDVLKDLNRYLDGKEMDFNYKIDFSDFTSFQRAVLKEMRKIPYGKTLSYSELAGKIGKPNSQRAVGNACNINPLPVIIPCHRVVAKDGIGGYGYNLDLKRYLLSLEDSQIS